MTRDEGLALLGRARSAAAVTAALSVIAPNNPRLRDAILQRYHDVNAEPRRLDADGGIRAVLLRGLRQCALAADIGLLEEAVQTYEFGARGDSEAHSEVACNLRAAGLLALAEIDEPLAEYHATRLLADPYTARGSREPALTAVRLLAATGQHLPLYTHLLQEGATGEEAAECFRALADAPASILLDLAERRQSSSDEIALLGMFDTLLGHPAVDRFSSLVMRFIEESPLLDLVAYVAAAIVAGRSEALTELLAGRATLLNPRGQLIRDALALRRP